MRYRLPDDNSECGRARRRPLPLNAQVTMQMGMVRGMAQMICEPAW